MKLRIDNRDLYLRGMALVIAIIFWMFAQQDMQVPSINEREQYQKIMKNVVFTDIREGILITSPVPEVFLEISGPFWELNQKQDEIQVYASLENKGAGRHSIKVNVKAPEGINVVQYYPDKIDVRLEKKETKEIKIEPILLGAPPADYNFRIISILPEKVIVSGPQSYVSQAQSATVGIDVSTPKPGLYKNNILIQVKDKEQKTIEGIHQDPQLAEVQWELAQQEGKKVPVEVVLNKKEENLDIKVNPQEVLVFGNMSKVNVVLTETVEIEEEDLPFNKEVSLIVPTGTEIWPKTVKVNIEKKSLVEEAR